MFLCGTSLPVSSQKMGWSGQLRAVRASSLAGGSAIFGPESRKWAGFSVWRPFCLTALKITSNGAKMVAPSRM